MNSFYSTPQTPHSNARPARLTLRDFKKFHASQRKIVCLTAYDATFAALLDLAGVDLLLVGDSLGNVLLGHETTIPVTLDAMIHHTAAVVRGCSRAFVVCDLPFGTTTDPETALRAAVRVFQETGAQAVKLEGGAHMAPTVKRLTEQGIPVMAHIGLTPQSVHQMGGYYTHGKSKDAAQRLLEDAQALEQAGAFSIVLECVTPEVAEQITQALSIPTIGIGASDACSGQILVTHDLVGLTSKPAPKFVKPRADLARLLVGAVQEYVRDVRGESTPSLPPEPRNGEREVVSS